MSGQEKIHIGFVMFEPRSGAFIWTLGENCLRTEALRRGMEFTTVAVRTVDEQAAQLFALIDKGMDAIILKPMARDNADISAFIAKAHSLGIPVVSLDSPLADEGLLCTVGSDNAKGQALVAEFVAERLQGHGKIAYFQGDARVPSGATRTRSFHQTMAKHPGITVAYEKMLDWLAHVSRREQGTELMREALAQVPDLDAVISTTDEGALGAMDVIAERGLSKRIIVAGFDGIPEALMAIRNGAMEVSVRQLPRLIATRTLDAVEAALRGEAVPKRLPVDVDLVTADKVDHSALDSLQLIPGLILHLASNHEEQRVLQQTIISTQQNILETVAAVSAAVSSIREPAEMMRQVVELLREHFSLQRASLYAVETSQGAEVAVPALMQCTADSGNDANEDIRISGAVWEPHLQRCLRTGEHLVIPAAATPLTALLLPLRSGTHVLGVLLLLSTNARAFNADVVSVMQAIAQQVAIALDNANLYRETLLNAKQQEESRERLLIAEKMASLGRLTAGIAHEMNTPLAAVRAAVLEMESLVREYSEAIGDKSVDDDDHREIAKEMSQAIKLASGAAERAAGFVRGIKSQTRDLSTQQLVSFNVITTIQEAILLLGHSLREKNCQISLRKSAEELFVFGSPSRFAQVVTNLITNAVDASFSSDKTKKDGINIDISLGEEPGYIVMQVRDEGCGIPPDVLPKIFEPMFSTKKFGDGTGLGLTIVNDIVTGDFKGSIQIESTVGIGTTFIVRLSTHRTHGTTPN